MGAVATAAGNVDTTLATLAGQVTTLIAAIQTSQTTYRTSHPDNYQAAIADPITSIRAAFAASSAVMAQICAPELQSLGTGNVPALATQWAPY